MGNDKGSWWSPQILQGKNKREENQGEGKGPQIWSVDVNFSSFIEGVRKWQTQPSLTYGIPYSLNGYTHY